jgi:signal transduction histidine kinase
MVETFAGQAAVVIEYARVHEELRRFAVMEDRERIAKELHDGVIQALFAVGMGLQATAALSSDEEIEGRLEQSGREIDRAIRDLRNYIFGLRPGILADRQLGQALRELATDFESKSGVTTVVDIREDVAAELASRAGDVVQVTRESLSNIGRHAQALTCSVKLSRDDDEAVLEIDDDGRGFDLKSARQDGNGVRNIRDRAQSLGGWAEITSTPGEGTTITVHIPIT